MNTMTVCNRPVAYHERERNVGWSCINNVAVPRGHRHLKDSLTVISFVTGGAVREIPSVIFYAFHFAGPSPRIIPPTAVDGYPLRRPR